MSFSWSVLLGGKGIGRCAFSKVLVEWMDAYSSWSTSSIPWANHRKYTPALTVLAFNWHVHAHTRTRNYIFYFWLPNKSRSPDHGFNKVLNAFPMSRALGVSCHIFTRALIVCFRHFSSRTNVDVWMWLRLSQFRSISMCVREREKTYHVKCPRCHVWLGRIRIKNRIVISKSQDIDQQWR